VIAVMTQFSIAIAVEMRNLWPFMLTKELSGFQYPDHRLLAQLGQDSHLDLAFLNVKHRVGDIALREHVLVLVKFQYRLSGSNFGEKDRSIKHSFACAHHANLPLLKWTSG
jgi:hypothetical protein